MARALAVYDALVFQRKPARLAPAGLSWTVPERLCVVGDMPLGLDVVCRDLGIVLEVTEVQLPLAWTIEATWRDGTASIFTEQEFRRRPDGSCRTRLPRGRSRFAD
jgi:hypothetical protein